MKEYKLQVPDDTVGLSITVLRQQKQKKLFVRNFNLKTVMVSYVLDLTEEPEVVLRRDTP